MKKLLFILLLFIYGTHISAQEICDSVRIEFKQSKSYIDFSLNNNEENLKKIIENLNANRSDTSLILDKILVVGAASPEGNTRINRVLSEHRADTLFSYIRKFYPLAKENTEFEYIGRDWKGLLTMVKADTAVPYRDESIALIEKIIEQVDNGIRNEQQINSLKRLRHGEPYWYMYQHLFPALRESRLYVWYKRAMPETVETPVETSIVQQEEKAVIEETVEEEIEEVKMCRPFYMGLKTNLLYDAMAVPNIGAEFYLGKNFSVAGNWMYSWWSNDSKHRYWRIYGGDLTFRRWFGKAANTKPLTGHHIGIYAQWLTYDIEWGSKGYMGGIPGGNIFDRASYGAGVEYGYSLPIAKRLNLDFDLGFGYFGGKYYEYKPIDDCYVWLYTKKRNWYGPTKAEISLVWLIGCDNFNRKKGGK